MEISISRGVSSTGVPFFTCNTCGLSFPTADLQRLHMKTDWHRYNLKRRVASLPPISSEVFVEKIMQQQAQEEEAEAMNQGRKGRGTGHRQATKKDKKREERLQRRLASNQAAEEAAAEKRRSEARVRSSSADSESVVSSSFSLGDPVSESAESVEDSFSNVASSAVNSDNDSQRGSFSDLDPALDSETASKVDTETVEEGDEIDRELQKRLARSKPIPPNCCFITGKEFKTIEENAEHLWKSYGLFIPEKEYLVDLAGLMTYLGEKVGLGNMCLYCGFEGRSLESIRAHMLAKSHIKIPYESVEDKLEISEYYDFTTSYKSRGRPALKTSSSAAAGDDDEEWEDESDEGEDNNDNGDDDEEEEYYPEQDAAYVDSTGMELAIGNLRVGHRSMARYYKQKFRPENEREGQGTVLAADSRSNGLLRPRNMVEERAQKRAWRTMKKIDNTAQRREGKFINNQKHYRDELLQ